jgi:hypothetical protein
VLPGRFTSQRAEVSTLEEGAWGRNLSKVSLPLARPNQALTHEPETLHAQTQHAATPHVCKSCRPVKPHGAGMLRTGSSHPMRRAPSRAEQGAAYIDEQDPGLALRASRVTVSEISASSIRKSTEAVESGPSSTPVRDSGLKPGFTASIR